MNPFTCSYTTYKAIGKLTGRSKETNSETTKNFEINFTRDIRRPAIHFEKINDIINHILIDNDFQYCKIIEGELYIVRHNSNKIIMHVLNLVKK